MCLLGVERDYLIAGAVVVENLQQTRTIHSQNQLNENLRTIAAEILPTNVEQTKPLANLKPDEQRQVWDKAVETAKGKVPSGRTVNDAFADASISFQALIHLSI